MLKAINELIRDVVVKVPEELLLLVIISGIIALPKWTWTITKKTLSHRSFKKIFGDDSFTKFHVIPGNLHLRTDLQDSNGQNVIFPYYKPQAHNPRTIGFFRTSIPVPYNETKAAKYITEAFEDEISKSPTLTHDEEVSDKLDISFCSFGGLNNNKTMDVLTSEQNVYIEFDPPNIIAKNDSQSKFIADTIYDYGVIVRIHPRQFPNRVWIAIAGLDESGTSGAAWYLAKNWKKLSKKANKYDFAIVVKVRRGQDESAEIVFENYN